MVTESNSSKEQVAFALMNLIRNEAHPDAGAAYRANPRKYLLDLYDECLTATKGQRMVR